MLPPARNSMDVTQIREDIVAINKAIHLHSKWLSDWNKKLVCRQKIADKNAQINAHKQCGFGQWYYGVHNSLLAEHHEFDPIEKLHEELHNVVKNMFNKANNDMAIEPEDYDAFIKCEVSFSTALVNLRDALFGQLYSFDYLTGIYNRQAFYAILEKEFARIKRSSPSCSAIIMVDIDHFKSINDQYGHQAGDKVLTNFSNYLKENLRPYDSVGRYGGEEFLMCLPNSTLDDAESIMERLREDLSNHEIIIKTAQHQTVTIKITASFGISLIDAHHPPSQAVETADMAMYSAKSAGRNRVIVHQYK